MNKTASALMFVALITSCYAQTPQTNLQWKNFESKESGMSVSLPCEPTKFFKSFQDTPRPIHVYSFSCEVEGMKFLISSKNHMDDFDEKTFKQTFEANESNLKTMFGAVEVLEERKNFLTNGFVSKYYDVKLKAGGRINMLVVINENRSYQAMFIETLDNEKRLKQKETEQTTSKKFIDSFQIIEK